MREATPTCVLALTGVRSIANSDRLGGPKRRRIWKAKDLNYLRPSLYKGKRSVLDSRWGVPTVAGCTLVGQRIGYSGGEEQFW
jgi:hypothetical protein